MRKMILLAMILLLQAGCCGLVCERQRHAALIIEKVENFRNVNGRLPETIEEVGMDGTQDRLSFYVKTGEDKYEVSYGLDVGISMVYDSKTKRWSEKG